MEMIELMINKDRIMIKVTIIKNEMTDQERRIDILLTEKSYDRLVDALYPVKHRESKGYIALVNFLYKDIND